MLVTESMLDKIAEATQIRESLAKSFLVKAAAADLDAKFDIFLSHAYVDRKKIRALKTWIEESTNLSVYVDWIIDKDLDRSNVSEETASRVRRRMENSGALIFAIPELKSQSKWMQWELGYFDGFCGRVAILPVLNSVRKAFRGQEYLGLYPYIDVSKDVGGNYGFFVNHQRYEKTYRSLKVWAQTGKLVRHRA